MSGRVTAFVALGSNLGRREGHLQRAREGLASATGIEVWAASRIYQTQPVGPAPQGAYLNAVLQLATTLSARRLLERLLEIEVCEGRTRGRGEPRWGPRTLDLDLLLLGEACIRAPGLEVPHPRLHERAFVLEPLCELAGARRHPRLGGLLSDYAESCRDPENVRIWHGACDWPVTAGRRRPAESHSTT